MAKNLADTLAIGFAMAKILANQATMTRGDAK
jgi:hypothetical protein